MNPWKKIATLFRKKRLDREMSEEMRLHLEFQIEQDVAKGMSPEEARYAEQRRFGEVGRVKEHGRRGEEFPVEESGARVSWNYFRTLHMRPLLGRTFGPADEVPATDKGYPARDAAMVLSHAWWQSHFGADPQILGRSVVLGGL